MALMEDLMRKIRSNEKWMLRTDGGSLNCWRQIVNKHGLTQDGKMCAEMVRMAGIHDEEG